MPDLGMELKPVNRGVLDLHGLDVALVRPAQDLHIGEFRDLVEMGEVHSEFGTDAFEQRIFGGSTDAFPSQFRGSLFF